MNGFEVAPGRFIAEPLLRFSYTTSSGPGGQNVNKRATRCELRVWLADLPAPPDALDRLRHAAGHLVTDSGELIITSGEHRSQLQNRDECLSRLREVLVACLARPKTRKKTRPSRSSKERRLSEKKRRGDVKRGRRGDE